MKNKRFLNLIVVFFKDTFKNKAEVFFTLLFPVLFLVIFGFVFGSMADDETIENYTFAVYGTSDESIKEYFAPDNVIFYSDYKEMENDVESGKIIIGIDVSDKENIKLIQSKNNENVNKSQWAVISAQNYLKKWITGLKENYFETEQKKVTSGRIQGNNLDYVLTGVIAFSILTGGMFSVIRVFGNYRKLGVIKRFMVAPVKPWEFVLSASVNKIILNLFSVIIIIFLGKIMYNLNYDFNWFLMLFVSVSATLGMMAVGILFLLLFKQTESASNAASLFSTAMTFFAGIYFPISFLPNFLQWIAYILPIKYIGDMIRYCAGIEEMKLSVFYGLNFTFIIVGIIFLVYASKKFVAKEN